MLERVQLRARIDRMHLCRDMELRQGMKVSREHLIRPLLPKGWLMQVHESSIMLHPSGRILPSVKIMEGRIFHDYGKRLAPKSELIHYESQDEMVEAVRGILQQHEVEHV